jgi:hypothetical protein
MLKLLALLLLSSSALAQNCTTLLYTGAPFTMVSTSGPNTTAVSSPVNGNIVLAAALPANGTSTFAQPPSQPNTLPSGVLSWDFSNESRYLSSSGGGGDIYNLASFSFTTVNGVIVSWTFTISTDNHFAASGDDIETVTSNVNGDTVAETYQYPAGGVEPSSITGSSTSPGIWVCQQTFTAAYPVAQPAPPAPAPAAPTTTPLRAQPKVRLWERL